MGWTAPRPAWWRARRPGRLTRGPDRDSGSRQRADPVRAVRTGRWAGRPPPARDRPGQAGAATPAGRARHRPGTATAHPRDRVRGAAVSVPVLLRPGIELPAQA